jgi:hypothetical protein
MMAGVRHAGIWLVLGLSGCAAGEAIDAPGAVSDTGSPVEDTAVVTDSETVADSFVADSFVADSFVADSFVADSFVADSFVADTTVSDTGFDSGFKSTDHVHIYIDNFCKVTTSPTSFTVPAGETLQLSYHNHSVDYLADVWMMYGGGYLELAKGGTWNETYKHCFGPSPSVGYADISIAGGGSSACPKVRLLITCK